MAAAMIATAQVKTGVEVLRDGGFKELQGKRVGLVTNPSGVDRNLKSTVDILNEAEGVKLVALYGPEHGVRGNAHAGDAVGDAVDAKTGVKTYSLYGKTHKPSPEMLKDIDVLVYDIQDIGCRSYTFYATMGMCMEACAENGKEFMVLDRPNAVSGTKVEGNLVEKGFFSMVSKYAIPYVYGLTPGELALYLNEEGVIAKKAKLTVIPMQGWKRNMTYAETGLPWVAPSPQIPTPDHAAFYAMSGVIGELYAFNTGIGYTLPFQCFATPYLDADKLADAMNALNLPGFRFRPINFKPFFKVGPEQVGSRDGSACDSVPCVIEGDFPVLGQGLSVSGSKCHPDDLSGIVDRGLGVGADQGPDDFFYVLFLLAVHGVRVLGA